MSAFRVLAGIFAVAWIAAPGLAEADPAYADLGLGVGRSHGAPTRTVTGKVGRKLSRSVAVEGEIGHGVGDGELAPSPSHPGERVRLSPKDEEAAYLVGMIPLRRRADLFARVGYGRTAYRVTPTSPAYNAWESGLRLGLGGEYLLNGVSGVKLEHSRLRADELHDTGGFLDATHRSSVWSVSFSRKF